MPLHRDFVAIVLAVVVSLTLLGIPSQYSTAVAETSQSSILTAGQWLFSSFISSSRNAERSRLLLGRNVELALENMRLREDRLENERLRRALDFRDREAGEDLIPARVIGRDADLIPSTITINAGREGGVDRDSVVITAEGRLLGHVTQLMESTSTVQLITRSRVSALIQERRVRTVVSWSHGNRFRLDYVEANLANNAIRVGDRVVSSGLGGRFPKGILIGEIVEVADNERDALFKAVFLESAVDFAGVEEVFVVQKQELGKS